MLAHANFHETFKLITDINRANLRWILKYSENIELFAVEVEP